MALCDTKPMAPTSTVTQAAISQIRFRSIFLCVLLTMAYGPCMAQVPRENLVTVKRILPLMDCTFEITVVAQSEEIGYINIEEAVAEIRRIGAMVDRKDSVSEVSRVNRQAGIAPVAVSKEFFQLVKRANKISELTEGAFDISFAALNRVWRFDGTMQFFPTPEAVYKARENVGFHKITLDESNCTIYLKEKAMQIDLAGIGKGYAVEKARDLLQGRQVPGGIINAGGDITSWGTKVSGEQWVIGIDNPEKNESLFTWVPLLDGSVATTNTYAKFLDYNGKRYSHILDPRTGYPVSGILKVAVFGRSSELCDAIATAITVLGVEKGIALVDQLAGVEAIILDNLNVQHHSKGFGDTMNRN